MLKPVYPALFYSVLAVLSVLLKASAQRGIRGVYTRPLEDA